MGIFTVVYFIVCLAGLLGYVNRDGGFQHLSREKYWLEAYTACMPIYYVYLIILNEFSDVQGSLWFMVFPLVMTLVIVSYFWGKFKNLRENIVDSLPFKIIAVLSLIFCNVVSVHLSSNIIETLTRTTSTDLQPFVDIAGWVYFILSALFLTQILFGVLLLIGVFISVKRASDKGYKKLFSFWVTFSLYVVNLALFINLSNYSFSRGYISEALFLGFHNNLSGEEKICKEYDEAVKLTLIGNNEALLASKDSDKIIFNKGKCTH